MVTASTALINFLRRKLPFFGAELVTMTLTSGTVFRFTSFDRLIAYGGHNYTPLGPWMKRSKLKLGTQLQTSTLEMQLLASPTMQVESQPILLLIAQGRFAGATVNIRRAFMTVGDVQQTPVVCNLTGAPDGSGDGTICRFVGTVGAATEITAISATLEVRDVLYQLNRPFPKEVYQAGCLHTLFDAGCTLDPASFVQTGAVSAGSTTLVINVGQSQDASIPAAPVSAPSLSLTGSDYILPWTGYYVVVTYLSASGGETTASPQSFIAASPGHLVVCQPPTSVPHAAKWRCYMGDGNGNEQLQSDSSGNTDLTLGSPFTSPVSGLQLSGLLPPPIPTTGYWSLGRIRFDGNITLALSGLSAFINGSSSSGAVSLAAPLPVAPVAGDTYSMWPGCDKSLATCTYKYSNSGHFLGFVSVPTPEPAGL